MCLFLLEQQTTYPIGIKSWRHSGACNPNSATIKRLVVTPYLTRSRKNSIIITMVDNGCNCGSSDFDQRTHNGGNGRGLSNRTRFSKRPYGAKLMIRFPSPLVRPSPVALATHVNCKPHVDQRVWTFTSSVMTMSGKATRLVNVESHGNATIGNGNSTRHSYGQVGLRCKWASVCDCVPLQQSMHPIGQLQSGDPVDNPISTIRLKTRNGCEGAGRTLHANNSRCGTDRGWHDSAREHITVVAVRSTRIEAQRDIAQTTADSWHYGTRSGHPCTGSLLPAVGSDISGTSSRIVASLSPGLWRPSQPPLTFLWRQSQLPLHLPTFWHSPQGSSHPHQHRHPRRHWMALPCNPVRRACDHYLFWHSCGIDRVMGI